MNNYDYVEQCFIDNIPADKVKGDIEFTLRIYRELQALHKLAGYDSYKLVTLTETMEVAYGHKYDVYEVNPNHYIVVRDDNKYIDITSTTFTKSLFNIKSKPLKELPNATKIGTGLTIQLASWLVENATK